MQLLHKSSCCCSVENGTTADTKTIQTATNSEGEATDSGVTAPLCPGRKFRSYRKLSCAFGYLVPRNVLYTIVYSYSQVCSVMYKILSVLPLFGDTDLSSCFVICSLPSLLRPAAQVGSTAKRKCQPPVLHLATHRPRS